MVSPRPLPTNELDQINNLLGALDPFFGLSRKLTVRSVQAFLLVASKEGQSVEEYARQAKTSPSTMSRNLADVAESNRHNEPGFSLVLRRENPLNRREREFRLSEKGRALARRIAQKLSAERR
jgi:DNA-binding MarR family transcriptional regulator